MRNHEQIWDASLRINTIGRDDTNADQHHHPYEPTPYCVLQRLAESGLIGKDDVLLDYGCGKGRVGFFLSSQTKAKTIGVEYDEEIFRGAMENQKTAAVRRAPDFLLTSAEAYEVPANVNRFYFFNPFTVEILQKVMARILKSWYESPRELYLFFYYPEDAYISYLMTVEELEFYDEIECDDLFAGNELRERILIFQLPNYEIGD